MNVPAELQALRIWTLHRNKSPMRCRLGRWWGAKSTDPATWGSFTACVRAAGILGQRHPGENIGVGMMLPAGLGLHGVDLDHCRAPQTGAIEPWAEAILDSYSTYAEFSQSGTGIHLYARGKKPGGRCRWNDGPFPNLEIYDRTRFLVVTGDVVPGKPNELRDCQAALDRLYQEAFGACGEPEKTGNTVLPVSAGTLPDDETIIEAISHSPDRKNFRALWTGEKISDSDTNLHLCIILAKWAAGDFATIDRLFRRSRLMRPKWDAPRGDTTWGANTIRKAVSLVSSSGEPFFDWQGTRRAQVDSLSNKEDSIPRLTVHARPSCVRRPVRPADFDHLPSSCRGIALPLQLRKCKTIFRSIVIPCRQHCCEECRHVRIKNLTNWYTAIVGQFEEVFLAKLTEEQFPEAKKQIQRRMDDGAVYVAVKLKNGLIHFMANVGFDGAAEGTTEEAIASLENAIPEAPIEYNEPQPGKQCRPKRLVRSSRSIAYGKPEMNPDGDEDGLPPWQRRDDYTHTPVSHFRLPGPLKKRNIAVRQSENSELEISSISFSADEEKFQEVMEEAGASKKIEAAGIDL